MTRRVVSVLLTLVLLVSCFSFMVVASAAKAESGLKISGSQVVAVGKKITLSANMPIKKWKSSDKKIATVSEDGVVKGKKAGKVKITATAEDGSKKSLKITVYEDKVKSVKIDASTKTLDLNGTKSVKLKAKASPEDAAQKFTWKSSDPSVATVSSSGKVTAVSVGKAKITATAEDGSKKNKSVTIKVKDSGKKKEEPKEPEEPKDPEEPVRPTGDLVKVGIITLDPAESGYRERNVEDLKNTFTSGNGYDASFVTAPTSDKQMKAFEGFISEGVKYILLCPAETVGWDDLLKKAKDAGIGVFLYDRVIDCDSSLYTACIVNDYGEEGKHAVAWLKKQNLSEYKVVHIQGGPGSTAQIGRSAALEKQCKSDSKWTMVAQGTGGYGWDPEEARKIVQKAIDSGKEFNVIYAENDGMARGAVEALDAAGITHGVKGTVMILSFDCSKWALRKVLAGEWNYDVQCSPFQAAPIDKMIMTLEGGGSISGLNSNNEYILPQKGFDAKTITQSDVDKYGLGD